MIEEEIFKKCLEKWGLQSQILMLAEEASELTQASLKVCRKIVENPLENLAEEIADTELMIDEINFYLSLKPMISKFRQEKLERLEKTLGES